MKGDMNIKILDYKITSRNSTVCGYPGRDYDWRLFDWEAKSAYKSPFKRDKGMRAPMPYIDDCLIGDNCQYLHVPYNYAENGTIYRVRPNDCMWAGKIYRDHLVAKQEAVKKADGWYWRLTVK